MYNDIRIGDITFSMMTISIMKFGIIDFIVILSIKETHYNDTQHKH
jgi:hypothetical protein